MLNSEQMFVSVISAILIESCWILAGCCGGHKTRPSGQTVRYYNLYM